MHKTHDFNHIIEFLQKLLCGKIHQRIKCDLLKCQEVGNVNPAVTQVLCPGRASEVRQTGVGEVKASIVDLKHISLFLKCNCNQELLVKNRNL